MRLSTPVGNSKGGLMVARNDPSRVFAGLARPSASGWIESPKGASQAPFTRQRMRESSRQESSC